MFTFDIGFRDGSNRLFEHIDEASYNNDEEMVTIIGDEIEKYPFPTVYDLYLCSSDQNITINNNDIRYIIVTKEN